MHIDGGCHCGYIKYEAEVDPESVGICHCTDCQTLTGTAYRTTVQSLKGAFKLLCGEPKIYIKTAESGNQRAHGFCPQCGTPLFATTVGTPDIYGIRVGTTRQRRALPPQRQGWCRSAQAWSMNIDALPKSAMQRPR